jgi:hypothetical protein
MTRRVLTSVVLVALLSLSTPAFAASRRDNGSTFLDRVIQQIHRVIHALDTVQPDPPKP